jgi:DNA-binding PadR family transcriptional regulator
MFEHLREMHREHHGRCHEGGHQEGRHEGREGRHRHRFGGFGGRWEGMEHGFGPGFGRGRERFFDGGQLRLVILQLIAEKPSYGYEIMKAIEERLSGGYAPSPGVVYPTLTLLEEEGLATVEAAEGNKKLYAATDAGREFLKANSVMVKAIFGRMEKAGKRFDRGRSPQIMRAMMNLNMALRMRTERGDLNAEQLSKIAEAIDAAARAIDEV